MKEITAQDLIEKIPLFKSGPRQGKIRNDALKEINRLLHAYSFSQQELKILEEEINLNTPPFSLPRGL